MRNLNIPAAGLLIAAVLVPPAELQAQSKIEFEGAISAVSGTSIELFGGLVRFEARGARIDTDDERFTNISDLRIGTNIEVEAIAGPDGSIQATLVEVSDESDADSEVGGVIGTVDTAGQTFTIGSVTIAWSGQTRFRDISNLRAGLMVEVTVQAAGGRLVALMVEREEDD
jgi:hypothetical protein